MSCEVRIFGSAKTCAKLRRHTEMSDWLKAKGDKSKVYRIEKSGKVHSEWCWKQKKGRWGRMATPKRRAPRNPC